MIPPVDPRCIPEPPPGYVFFTNYGAFDYDRKIPRTEEMIRHGLQDEYGCHHLA